MENDPKSPIDYAAVLADLLARRDALDKAIEAVRPLAGEAISAPGNQAQGAVSVRGDSFFGMTIPDAAKKLFGMMRKPLTAPEIAKYLVDGGFAHTSSNFANTVNGVLNRSAGRDGDGIVKIGRGQFGLVEWYPGYRRKNKKNGDDSAEGEDEAGAA